MRDKDSPKVGKFWYEKQYPRSIKYPIPLNSLMNMLMCTQRFDDDTCNQPFCVPLQLLQPFKLTEIVQASMFTMHSKMKGKWKERILLY